MYERLPQELKAHAGFCGWRYEQRGGAAARCVRILGIARLSRHVAAYLVRQEDRCRRGRIAVDGVPLEIGGRDE